jgi:hypothetical protein
MDKKEIISTSLLGEYLQNVVMFEASGHPIDQPPNMSDNLLHDSHHLARAIRDASKRRRESKAHLYVIHIDDDDCFQLKFRGLWTNIVGN